MAISRKVFKRGGTRIYKNNLGNFPPKKMTFDLTLFNNYLTLKGLSDRYKRELMYYGLRLNIYGKFNQEVVNRFLLDKSNQSNVGRAFIELFKKFLIHYKEELITKGELTQEELIKVLEVEVPSISGRSKVRINVPLTKNEMDLIEKTLETEELKLMFLISYNGGLRLQELLSIRVDSFNWKEIKEDGSEMGEVRVLGKGNKEGVALLPFWLIKRISYYIKANTQKFTKSPKLFKVSGRFFELHIKKAGVMAGITKKGENGEWIKSTIVHPHKLRHQLGHDLMREGKHMRVIQEALRHSNISSTQRYTQISKAELKQEMISRNKPKE